MGFLDQIQTQQFERIPLEPGHYGDGKNPGLKILSYLENASKPDKNKNMQYAFLVAALRPSREQLEAQKNGKGTDHPFGTDAPDGTAFLSLTLGEMWLNAEAAAIAFTEASKNKSGEVQANYEQAALDSGDVTADSIRKAKSYFQRLAAEKVADANTPQEQVEEAFQLQYHKELQQVAIKLGQFLTLQDWLGKSRKLNMHPMELVGTQFSGNVETSTVGKGGSQVTAIYSKKK